jgi:hypothetical protein
MMATRIGKLSIRWPSALHAVAAAARVGLVALAIAVLGVTPARAGVADPTLLPVATTSQVPLTSAYNGLGVPSMAAGTSYADPTTHAKIYKLTSGSYPVASAHWGHDYADGGDEISLPYNGSTRAVLVHQNANSGGPYFLVDFTPGVGVSNPRQLTGPLAPWIDLAFTFSNNPATPYYAYVASGGGSGGGTIRRFDIRTMTEAPGNGWPKTDIDPVWLHQSENDGLFTWLRGANGRTAVGYEPSTGTLKAYTNAGLNEPRIDRAGRYIGLAFDSPWGANYIWDWNTNTITWTTPGDPGPAFGHVASLRRRWLGVDWNLSFPDEFSMWTSDVPNSLVHIGGPAPGTLVHGSGNWIQHPADLNDQWAAFLTYGALQPTGAAWLAPGGIVLITPNGQRRLLGHSYNTTSDYNYLSFAKFSSDGQYLIFTSDMNGTGRSDVFLAELPQSGGITPPPSTYSLGVLRAGSGAGTVTSAPSGISCGATCSATFTSGTAVVLTATPDSSSTLASWSGCGSVLGAQCSVTLTSAKTVTATFQPLSARLTISKTGTGTGTVTSPTGISCGTVCSQDLTRGTTVTLTATAATGSTYTGWSGGGCGGTGTCAVQLMADTTITATFGGAASTDTTRPTASITAPAAGQSVSGTVTVTASATDNVGVVGVQFKLDGGNLGAEVATAPYAVSWNTTTAAAGTHALTAVARDAAGNTTTSASVSVTVGSGTVASSGLVGYWKFDDASGTTATDSSGAGNTGTLVNGPTWTTGKVGSALAFDGLSEYVNVPSTAALNAFPLTVAVWLKTSTASGVRGVVTKYTGGAYNGYDVFLSNGNLCAWYIRDTANFVYDGSGCPFNVAGYNDNQWHHVVYVVDAAGGRLYVDGVQKGSLGWTGSAGAPTTTQPVQIGRYPGAFGGAEYFPGLLDDVRIYNTALSTSDVLALSTAATSSGAGEPITWTNLVNVTATGNSLAKTGGCDGCADAGANSLQSIGSIGGYVAFTASEPNTLRILGLTGNVSGTGSNGIKFGIRLQAGIAEVREKGVYKTDTTFLPGDVFRIQVKANKVVTYHKNGTLFYTSTLAASFPLRVDTSLNSLGATLDKVVFSKTP